MKSFDIAKKVIDNCITISVGPHVTELSEEVLKNYPSLDFVIRGEGEITFAELLDKLETGKELDDIKGIAYRDNGSINKWRSSIYPKFRQFTIAPL